MKVFVRPAAAAEIEEAWTWYEAKRTGLGADLLRELRATMSRILAAPRRFRVVHRQTRRVALSRFPYAILYRIEPDGIVVVAFFHGHRDPRVWRDLR